MDSRYTGMLFVMGAMNFDSGNVVPVGVLPDGSGWDVRINDQGLNFPNTEQAKRSFLYVPYGAPNLLTGGRLSLAPTDHSTAPPTAVKVLTGVGSFTASIMAIRNSSANCSIIPPSGGPDLLTDAGRILIQIPGKNNTTGQLLIGASKYAGTTVSGADDNFLTYEYYSALGGFLVETYDLNGANLQNSDIYFAYFDYATPLEVPEPNVLALTSLGALAAWIMRRRALRR